MIQELLVILTLLGAFVYLIRRIRKTFSLKGDGCSGCVSCGGVNFEKMHREIQQDPRFAKPRP